MKHKAYILAIKIFLITLMLLCLPVYQVIAAKKITSVRVVGLYSETDAGYVSYRVGSGRWTVVKIGDKIPFDAEISISVDRDWVEICPSENPNEVYELTGSETGTVVTKKVSEILKGKKRKVSFPNLDKPDKKFTNKVVVKEYWGKQNYRDSEGFRYIKYGDVLDATGTVQIIAINNTLTLVFANGKETKVIGPLKFQVEKLLKGENLYKYLNVK
jgi:hypothetical protein